MLAVAEGLARFGVYFDDDAIAAGRNGRAGHRGDEFGDSDAVTWIDNHKNINRFIIALGCWTNGSRLLQGARAIKYSQTAEHTNSAVIKEKILEFEGAASHISTPQNLTVDTLRSWVNSYHPHYKATTEIFESATDAFKNDVASDRDKIVVALKQARDGWKGPFDNKLAEMITDVWLPRVQPAQLDGASGTPIKRTRASNGFKADHEMLVWMVEAHSDFDKLARALGEPFEDFSRESIAFFSKLAEAGEKIAILSLATGEAFVQELKCASDSALDVEKHSRICKLVKEEDAGFPLMK